MKIKTYLLRHYYVSLIPMLHVVNSYQCSRIDNSVNKNCYGSELQLKLQIKKALNRDIFYDTKPFTNPDKKQSPASL